MSHVYHLYIQLLHSWNGYDECMGIDFDTQIHETSIRTEIAVWESYHKEALWYME